MGSVLPINKGTRIRKSEMAKLNNEYIKSGLFYRRESRRQIGQMPFAREMSEEVAASFSTIGWGVAAGNQGVSDLVRPGRIDKPHMTGGKHARDGAPSRGDDRNVEGESFDEREGLTLERMNRGQANDVRPGKQVAFFAFVDHTDMANGAGGKYIGLREKSFLIPAIRKTASDDELKGARFAAIRHGDGGEQIENPFRGRAESDEENLCR